MTTQDVDILHPRYVDALLPISRSMPDAVCDGMGSCCIADACNARRRRCSEPGVRLRDVLSRFGQRRRRPPVALACDVSCQPQRVSAPTVLLSKVFRNPCRFNYFPNGGDRAPSPATGGTRTGDEYGTVHTARLIRKTRRKSRTEHLEPAREEVQQQADERRASRCVVAGSDADGVLADQRLFERIQQTGHYLQPGNAGCGHAHTIDRSSNSAAGGKGTRAQGIPAA